MAARILIIEDNAASLELLRYLVEQSGHAALTAPDGETGLRLAREAAPHLILCDLQLPGIDGLGIARRLRADPAWTPVKLVAVTAYSMPGDRETALAAGFDEYMTKPIDPTSVMDAIESLLPEAVRGGRR